MTKIEWCDMTWNPVWGCRNNCEYWSGKKSDLRGLGNVAEDDDEMTSWDLNMHV